MGELSIAFFLKIGRKMEILGLEIHAWFTIVTVVVMFGLLLKTKLPVEIVFLGGMGALIISGSLPMKEAVSGFSSETVVVIALMFIVVAGLFHTGVLQWVVKNLLGKPKGYARAITKLMLPVAFLSSLLNNTTVVMLFISVVKMWAKKLGITPSKMLIPLSYAAGLGGVCTIIGSPTNLVIASFYKEKTGEAVSFFEPLVPGLFCVAVLIVSVIAMRRLLPDRKSPDDSFESISDYTVELLVPTESKIVGSSVKECGLDNVNGGHLIEIVRFDKEIISPVGDEEFIFGGDRLIFSGDVASIIELRKSHELVSATEHVYKLDDVDRKRKISTAYVTFTSSLIGKTIVETDYENKYNMVLVAVARSGERIETSPHEVVLRAGDTLMLEGRNINKQGLSHDLHFFDSESVANYSSKTVLSTLIMLAMILLAAFDIIPLLQACFLAAFAMLLTRCCNIEQAERNINWKALMVFAGSICFGKAIEHTGLSEMLATWLLDVCGPNPILVLTVICLVTTFATEFISNTATSAMFFPIAYDAATSLGCDPMMFCMGLMIAAASSFATPIGSPTHMLVYAPGGYRFIDFVKIGLPMNFIILAANIFIVVLLYK